jgi:hypothetical protein
MSIDFPKEEERILARWKEIDAFLTQVELVSHESREPQSVAHAGCGENPSSPAVKY